MVIPHTLWIYSVVMFYFGYSIVLQGIMTIIYPVPNHSKAQRSASRVHNFCLYRYLMDTVNLHKNWYTIAVMYENHWESSHGWQTKSLFTTNHTHDFIFYTLVLGQKHTESGEASYPPIASPLLFAMDPSIAALWRQAKTSCDVILADCPQRGFKDWKDGRVPFPAVIKFIMIR